MEKNNFDDASLECRRRQDWDRWDQQDRQTTSADDRGTEVPDDGQIIRQNGMKIAHLTQNPVFPKRLFYLMCRVWQKIWSESTEQSEYTRNHRSYNED